MTDEQMRDLDDEELIAVYLATPTTRRDMWVPLQTEINDRRLATELAMHRSDGTSPPVSRRAGEMIQRLQQEAKRAEPVREGKGPSR